MATNTTPAPTVLDDLKDLAWLTKDRIESTYNELSAQDIFLDDDGEGWALANLNRSARETLAKHVPGMSVNERGLPVYDSDAAYAAAHTYDDGTPLVERIKFPDVDGVVFTYRPRHDRPREEFMAWAREVADQHKADLHARYATAGEVGIEYTGSDGEPFQLHIRGAGDDAHTVLDREELIELREGIDRILATQERAASNDQHEGKK